MSTTPRHSAHPPPSPAEPLGGRVIAAEYLASERAKAQAFHQALYQQPANNPDAPIYTLAHVEDLIGMLDDEIQRVFDRVAESGLIIPGPGEGAIQEPGPPQDLGALSGLQERVVNLGMRLRGSIGRLHCLQKYFGPI
jgi:hypothetical protein